jgi:pSer/pThr/pTyr-binding forkhead associated (FHA) protein
MERIRIYRAALALDNFTIGELAAHCGVNTNTVRSLVTSRARDYFEVVGHQSHEGRGRPAQRFRLRDRKAVQAILRDHQGALSDDQNLIGRADEPQSLPTVEAPDPSPTADLLLTLGWAETQILRAADRPPDEARELVKIAQQAADDVLTAASGLLDEDAMTRVRLLHAFATLLGAPTEAQAAVAIPERSEPEAVRAHRHPLSGMSVHALPRTLRAASAGELQERLDAARSDGPFVLYRDADERQQIVVLEGSARLSIGRQPASDVPLPWDSSVSRVHATLERVGDEWTLVDAGSSRNGTFVNGDRVHGRRRLCDGDLIRVGVTTIAYAVPCRPTTSSSTIAATSTGVPPLTAAQRRVLVALCRPIVEGSFGAPSSNQQIAAELVVGVETVKTHMRTLFEAFGIQGMPQNEKRAELARLALRRGAVRKDELLTGAPPGVAPLARSPRNLS